MLPDGDSGPGRGATEGRAGRVVDGGLADGHAGADLAALDMDAIGDALRRACERMDALEIPA